MVTLNSILQALPLLQLTMDLAGETSTRGGTGISTSTVKSAASVLPFLVAWHL